jgi:TRAP-type uncharacterized transport system fused permease subunit
MNKSGIILLIPIISFIFFMIISKSNIMLSSALTCIFTISIIIIFTPSEIKNEN